MNNRNNGRKVKDAVILGLLGGLIGTTVMDISNYILWKNKQTEGLYGHLSGSLFLPSIKTHLRKHFLLGQIMHILTGATLGLPVVYMLKRTGKNHHIIKGALAGSLTWGILFNFGMKLKLFSSEPESIKSLYSALFNNFLYGVTTAQAIVSFAHSSVFPDNQSRTTDYPESQ